MTNRRAANEVGAGLLEYALLVALIALVAIPAIMRMQAPIGEVVCKYVHLDSDTSAIVHTEDGRVGCKKRADDPLSEALF